MYKIIDRCFDAIIEEIGMQELDTALEALVYPPTKDLDFINLLHGKLAWFALEVLRAFINSSKPKNEKYKHYIRKEVTRYIHLSEIGNHATALEVEDQLIKYNEKLEKIIPHLQLSEKLLNLLKHDWIIHLLFFQHTSVTQLQKIEAEKPILFNLLHSSDIPDLVLQGKSLTMEELLNADNNTLLSIQAGLTQRPQPGKLSRFECIQLAEITHCLLFAQKQGLEKTKVAPLQTDATLRLDGLKATQ